MADVSITFGSNCYFSHFEVKLNLSDEDRAMAKPTKLNSFLTSRLNIRRKRARSASTGSQSEASTLTFGTTLLPI